jgi:MFS family permease
VVRYLKRLPFFYGWIIVGISFLTLAVGYGARASFSVFLVSIQDTYGWSRGAISLGFTLHMLVALVGLPAVGAVVDRYGPRRILSIGITITAVGMWLLGGLRQIWHFYIFYGLVMAFGRIMISMVPHTAIISNWFKEKRGTAMGVAAAGIGIGSILMVPLAQFAISKYGWSNGCRLMAVFIFLIIFPLTAVFQRHRPSQLGLFIDGKKGDTRGSIDSETGNDTEAPAGSEAGWTVREAISTLRFWLLYTVFFLSAMITMIQMHQIAFFQDVGFGRNTAVSIFAAVGLIQSLGVFSSGALSDKIGREWMMTLGFALQIIGILILLQVHEAYMGIKIWLFMICYGFGNGSRTAILPTMTADLFPGERVGSVYGILASAITISTSFAPWFAGYLFDVTGSYRQAFSMVIGCLVMACIVIWLVAPQQKKKDRR